KVTGPVIDFSAPALHDAGNTSTSFLNKGARMSIAPTLRLCLRSVFASALCLVMTGSAAALSINNVSVSPASPGRLQPFTVDFTLSQSYNNPYDPDEIDVTFSFTGPSSVQR